MIANEQDTVQIISRGGVVYCTTTVPYPPDIISDMKKAGYKIKVVNN
jgi:hypothetical protein